MKYFSMIEPQKIKFDWGQLNAVVLGEEGRGRRLTYVPVPYGIKNGDIVASRSGRPKIIRSNHHTPGWVAVLSSTGTYTRNRWGTISVKNEQADNVTFVTSGHGAYGLAGRVGGWIDAVIIVQPRTVIQVHPAGGWKIPRIFFAFEDDKVYKFSSEEYEAAMDQIDWLPPIGGGWKVVDALSIKQWSQS